MGTIIPLCQNIRTEVNMVSSVLACRETCRQSSNKRIYVLLIFLVIVSTTSGLQWESKILANEMVLHAPTTIKITRSHEALSESHELLVEITASVSTCLNMALCCKQFYCNNNVKKSNNCDFTKKLMCYPLIFKKKIQPWRYKQKELVQEGKSYWRT